MEGEKKLADAGASFVAFTPGAAFVIAAGPPRWLRLWDLKTSKIATSYLSTVAKGVGTANGAAPGSKAR